MKIYEVTARTPHLTAELLTVWEASVRATHLFLSDAEILQIKEYVPQALQGIAHLIVAEDDAGAAVGFMGIEDGRLEMLFLSPAARGQGLGRRLLEYGITRTACASSPSTSKTRRPSGFISTWGLPPTAAPKPTSKAAHTRFCICGEDESHGPWWRPPHCRVVGDADPYNAKNTCRPDRCFSLLYRTLVFTVMSAL